MKKKLVITIWSQTTFLLLLISLLYQVLPKLILSMISLRTNAGFCSETLDCAHCTLIIQNISLVKEVHLIFILLKSGWILVLTWKRMFGQWEVWLFYFWPGFMLLKKQKRKQFPSMLKKSKMESLCYKTSDKSQLKLLILSTLVLLTVMLNGLHLLSYTCIHSLQTLLCTTWLFQVEKWCLYNWISEKEAQYRMPWISWFSTEKTKMMLRL